jgi:hypothetical protein
LVLDSFAIADQEKEGLVGAGMITVTATISARELNGAGTKPRSG